MLGKERLFVETLEKTLKEKISAGGNKNKLRIEKDRNLLYRVIVNANQEYAPRDLKDIRRGNFAFQTDLLISCERGNKTIPLVVIEVKYGGLTTHDVLTYSTKARKHKYIYPYLRYGLVIGSGNRKGTIKSIPNRFFTHNTDFDFACVVNVNEDSMELNSRHVDNLIKLLNKQINDALLLLDITESAINNERRNRKRLEYFFFSINYKEIET